MPALTSLLHAILRSVSDHTGRLLEHEWVDLAGRIVIGALRWIPLLRTIIPALARHFRHSWSFSCVTLP